MKIGTFLCRLLGHKFCEYGWDLSDKNNTGIEQRFTYYCVRCGIKREY